jgi:hypothetical protein
MTNSNNQQAVAVKTRVNAGPVYGALTFNHNETVVVKTRVSAGTINWGGIIAVL